MPGWGESVARYFRKYATFSGRASRSEFWWPVVLGIVVTTVCEVISTVVAGGYTAAAKDKTDIGDVLGYLWSAVTFVPSLAVSWRRLHDSNHTGLWNIVVLVPIVGWIILLVYYLSGPNPEGARFDR